MRFSRLLSVAAAAMLLLVLFSVPASAFVPYETYTYLADGERAASPHAYVPSYVENGSGLGFSLNSPQDICMGTSGEIIISDTGNNRIVIISPDEKSYRIIAGFESEEGAELFSAPTGTYMDDEGRLYIADSGNGRVVVLGADGALERLLGRPETDFLDKDKPYVPKKVAADEFERIYVVADDVAMGLIVFDAADEFTGFLGSQRVSYNLADYLWKRFMTEAQKKRMVSFVPMSYSNVVCDSDGFVYAVNTSLENEDLVRTIASKNNDGRTSPIKKLNPTGNDVLLRTAVYPPVGDIDLMMDEEGNAILSSIVDVALGEENTYTMLDRKRNRIFTYGARGDLLFAFGGASEQVGNTVSPAAICYRGSDLIVLDQKMAQYTVFTRTEYGDELMKAIALQNKYLFEEAEKQWRNVLTYHPDNDLAYNGIGLSLLSQEKYSEAMNYFSLTKNHGQYSKAFEGYRKQVVGGHLLLVIIAIVVIIFALSAAAMLLARLSRSKKPGLVRKTAYGFHILFHPFDGFWDLRHENRGSLTGGIAIFSSVILSQLLRELLMNEQFAGTLTFGGLLQTLLQNVGIVLLFVVANWCLTTLMDGKAHMADIFTVCCYATLPLLLSNLICIPLSHILTLNEALYITFFSVFGLVWTLFLFFCGIMTVQQYSFTKNIATSFLTVIGMGIISFILVLLVTTVAQICSVIQLIVLELIR